MVGLVMRYGFSKMVSRWDTSSSLTINTNNITTIVTGLSSSNYHSQRLQSTKSRCPHQRCMPGSRSMGICRDLQLVGRLARRRPGLSSKSLSAERMCSCRAMLLAYRWQSPCLFSPFTPTSTANTWRNLDEQTHVGVVW